LVSEHGVECDFEENGMLEAAMNDEQARQLEEHQKVYASMGLESALVQGKELEAEVKSPRYVAGLKFPHGGIVNPAKLARGTKTVVEKAGVEVRERTVVMRVTPGKEHRVETEMGEIRAPILVLGLNGYSCKLGFFRNRVIPLCSYVIATEPLSAAQWEAIGWQNRQGIADMRLLFDYQRPTADGRIVIGGSDYPYYANDALSSGNNKPVIELLTRSLFTTFPQLEGLRIDHAWGGTMGFTLDFTPSVGILGEHKNLFYGVAYNGEGVAFGQTAGRIITDLIAGEESDLTKLFVVNHRIPYAGPEKLRIVSARLQKWYLMRTSEKTVR
jgi:glycine/D-amino acid oxidase-like deaminating enzyme